MKKLFAIALVFLLALTSCGREGDDNENSNTSVKTTVTITNASDYTLLDVEYLGVNFDTINSGNMSMKEVSAGTIYVYFYLSIVGEKVRCRTALVEACENGVSNKITITNYTSIVTVSGDEITGSLKTVFDTLTIELSKPQIRVKQGSVVIKQYGEQNFETVRSTFTRELTFIIENIGRSDLIIDIVNGNKINLTENSSGFFSVNIQPLSSTIAAVTSFTFTIQFSPTIVGNNFNAAVNIKTNSRTNDEFIFLVKGNCSNPLQVGDTGLGGGMVFFAEGTQYKECSGELGVYNLSVALLTAKNFGGGGFTDWHLPDNGELDLMYKNLYQKGLGGFLESYYWSSSSGSYGRAMFYNFSNGICSETSYISNLYLVRSVRSFSIY